MRFLPSFCLCVLPAALLCAATATAQQASPAIRIVNPIDEKQLVTLKGTVHALANAWNDRGAAPDEMQLDRMHLVLKRSDSQEAALRARISEMHTPGTASYHKWLTPEAFGKQFGPADEDIAAVETWLTGHGFSVTKVNPGKQTIEFAGNAGQFRSAFHAAIHKYAVNGETHYANTADPQIPAALAPVVAGFVSLNNFRAKSYAKYLGKAQYDPKTDRATPEWTIGNSTAGYNYVLAPQDFAVQYDLNPLYAAGTNGSGQAIAIVNESNINIALVNNFRSLFGLSANPPQVIIDGNDPGVDGINNPDGPNGASVEAYLDVEWAGAVAPDATIDLVIGADTALESGLILAAEHAVYGNVAPVMSVSFGECEGKLGSATNTFLNYLWMQAAAQGITVMVSSGDNGSAGCDNDDTQEYAKDGLSVNGFASTPYNVAVGGTDFYYSDYSQGLTAMETQMGTYWSATASNNAPAVSIKGVIPEQPWNDSQYGLTLAALEQGASPSTTNIIAGSGGASYLYTKPAWQTGFGDTAHWPISREARCVSVRAFAMAEREFVAFV
jgi:subtilase family serine protease